MDVDAVGEGVAAARSSARSTTEQRELVALLVSTVYDYAIFALDPDGTINPENTKSLPGAETLDSADAIVMLVRYRAWPDDAMKHSAGPCRGAPHAA